jgi:hypothetical protein
MKGRQRNRSATAQGMEPTDVDSLDRRERCAKIRVVAFAVMEVRMLPPGQESRSD